jgi:hypothetical protein
MLIKYVKYQIEESEIYFSGPSDIDHKTNLFQSKPIQLVEEFFEYDRDVSGTFLTSIQ